MLAAFFVRAKGLDIATLALGHEDSPAVRPTKCQICGFFSLKRDLPLNRSIRRHHSDRPLEDFRNKKLTIEVGTKPIDSFNFKRFNQPSGRQFVTTNNIIPNLARIAFPHIYPLPLCTYI